jgi:2,5-furandicarboxylate decarboxylase 1
VHDFRSFIALLEDAGELDHISREVDPRFELAGVMGKLEAERRAFRFEHVTGARFPAVGGLYNKLERFGLALGHPAGQPFGHEDFDALLQRAKAKPVDPSTVEDGPVKQVRVSGPDVDLAALPVPTFFELDSGPFITAAVGIARDPISGEQNIGIYRTLIIGRNRCVVNASSLSDLRRIYANWERIGQPMPIALAIGVEPAMQFAAACKLPPNVCEYGVAGALKGAPMQLVRCENSDLLVPANAEFIIEGSVDFSERVENLLGEFAGQYGPETAPVTEVQTLTHRENPLFYALMAGRNPEHNSIGHIAVYDVQRSICGALKEVIPEIKQVHVFMNPGLGTLGHAVISIDKTSDAQPRQIIEAAFKAGGHIFPVSKITKRVVVVDDDVDVTSMDDVQWAIWNRAAAASKFMIIPDVESWELERAAKAGMKSVRVGIDATMDLEDVDKLIRPATPGADRIRLEDYLDRANKSAA